MATCLHNPSPHFNVCSFSKRKGVQRVRNIRDQRGEDTFIRKTSLVKNVGWFRRCLVIQERVESSITVSRVERSGSYFLKYTLAPTTTPKLLFERTDEFLSRNRKVRLDHGGAATASGSLNWTVRESGIKWKLELPWSVAKAVCWVITHLPVWWEIVSSAMDSVLQF